MIEEDVAVVVRPALHVEVLTLGVVETSEEGEDLLEVEVAVAVVAVVAEGISIVLRWLLGAHLYSRVFNPGPVDIDARLRDNSQDAVVQSLKSLTIKPNELPVRPNFGTAGTPIKLRANFFPIKVPKGPFYEYEVSISPVAGTAIRRVKRRIFQLAEQSPQWAASGLRGNVAHDHSSKLIAAKKLPQPISIPVPFYDEGEQGPKQGGKQYTLTIEYQRDIEFQSLMQSVLHSFDTL